MTQRYLSAQRAFFAQSLTSLADAVRTGGYDTTDIDRADRALRGNAVPLADGESWQIRCPFTRISDFAVAPDGQIIVTGEGGPLYYNNGGVVVAVGNIFDARKWRLLMTERDLSSTPGFFQWVNGEWSFFYLTDEDEYHMVWGDWDVTIPLEMGFPTHDQGYQKHKLDFVTFGRRELPWCWTSRSGTRHMAFQVSIDRTLRVVHAKRTSRGRPR